MEVFEFNGNKSINKQLMLFKEVKSIIIYQYFNKTYIITFHETENSTLFQWDGKLIFNRKFVIKQYSYLPQRFRV